MYPAAFSYHRPGSVQEALRLLQSNSEAKLLAGGHSLIPLMKMRFAQPPHLIDLRDLKELKGIRIEDGHLAIGAMTTHWDLQSSPLVHEKCPVLSDVAAGIGDPQVRNFGTIGGSLVHADPGADYPAIALAMDATFVCQGTAGRRTVKATDWFLSLLTTEIHEDEILVDVRFPLPAASWGAAYVKMPDPASRLAMIGVAAVVALDATDTCSWARLGVTGASSVPARGISAERILAGKKLDDERIENAADALGGDLEFEAHRTCTAEDRQELCKVLARRAVTLAKERAKTSFSAR